MWNSVAGYGKQRRQVRCLGLPGAVVVVTHDRHEVDESRDLGDVVALVDDLLVAAQRHGQAELGLLLVELPSKFGQEFGEVWLVGVGTTTTVALPAAWVVPLERQALEVVLVEELDRRRGKLASRRLA